MRYRKILTNFFPIDLYHPDTIKLKVFPYTREELKGLRDKFNETHSFFRFGDTIYGAWMVDEPISGNINEINPGESPKITSALIKHIFFRAFISNTKGIVPLGFHPLSFISKRDKHDAAHKHLPDNLRGFISFDRQYEISLRTISEPGKDLRYGFTITINHRWNISKSLEKLDDKGIDLSGFNVVHSEPIPGKKGILAPTESFIGKVTKIKNGVAFINTNEGQQEFSASELYLRRNTKEIRKLLTKLLSEDQAEKIVKKSKKSSYLKSNYKKYYSKIEELVSKRFSEWRYYCKNKFEFIFSGSSELDHYCYSLKSNKFIFDYGTNSANTSIIQGLKEFGPFDSNSFTPKSPEILVICSSKCRRGFSYTMKALRDGISSSSYYRRGMKDLFRLQEMIFNLGELKKDTAEGYLEVIKEKLAENDKYDLVIVEGTDKHEYAKPEENPYYRVKAFLLSKGIPVQALQEKHTQNKNNLEYILTPFALQIYSKMGGVPWVLSSYNDVDWEIVVGISHTYIRNNQYVGGQSSRIVGLTTFFSSDGNLLFSDNSKATDYDNFFNELLLSLKSSVNKLSQDMAWKKGQTVRFVFHVFKPMKNTELEVVKELINKFSDFEIHFAFVQVIDKHPFLLFDKQSKGAVRRSRVNKKYVPLRKTNLILNEHECLLQTRGANELKIPGNAPSRPVLIRLHEDSTFKDMHHITQQVFKFTHHSWRSINPTHMPVTLYYAQMIARLLGKLRNIPDHNPESLLSMMKRKKWFL